MEKKELNELSNEELLKVVEEQNTVIESLHKALKDEQRELVLTRLSFLFKVLDNKDCFSSAVIDNTVKDIESILFNTALEKKEGSK